ncbi:hypothetical protein Dimus_010714 [Dionaea muscipula]
MEAPAILSGGPATHSDEDHEADGCEKLSCLRPRLSPILEETGLAAGEILELDGAASSLVMDGQTSGDLQSSPSQVCSPPSSLLPLEPNMTLSFESAVGLEEKGKGMVCSVQGSQVDDPARLNSPLLPLEMATEGLTEMGEGSVCSVQGYPPSHAPVTVPVVMAAEVQGGHQVQPLRAVGQGGDFHTGDPLMAGMGTDKFETTAARGELAWAHGASEGSGV